MKRPREPAFPYTKVTVVTSTFTQSRSFTKKGQSPKNDQTSLNKSSILALKTSSSSHSNPNNPIPPLFLDVFHPPEISYMTINSTPIRVIPPYPYTFTSNAKGRWQNRALVEVFTTEFGAYPAVYYQDSISDGRILVNARKVPLSYVIKLHDIITHTVHRHEPPVRVHQMNLTNQSPSSTPIIQIITCTPSILAVDKPCTIPIHTSGSYHFNSLYHTLLEQLGHDAKIFIVHRLDRLTSGVTIFARTQEAASELSKAIMDRQAQKYYLARVKGNFGEINLATTMRSLKLEVNDNDNDNAVVNGQFAKDGSNACGWWYDHDDVHNDNHNTTKTYKEIAEAAISSPSTTKWLNLASPITVVSHQRGIYKTGPPASTSKSTSTSTPADAKPSQTKFLFLQVSERSERALMKTSKRAQRTNSKRSEKQMKRVANEASSKRSD